MEKDFEKYVKRHTKGADIGMMAGESRITRVLWIWVWTKADKCGQRELIQKIEITAPRGYADFENKMERIQRKRAEKEARK